MELEGKTVIITSNSTVFLKLTKSLIENSSKSRSDFIIVAENGLTFKERFWKRKEKIGILSASDEWLFTLYESIFNHWKRAEKKYLDEIDITSFSPDILTDSVNKSNVNVLSLLENYEANSIISIGSGYIPIKVLNLFNLKVNIHPGILPFYKGLGSPEAIMKGDVFNIGWSIHELISKIDAGSIFEKKIINYSLLKKLTFAEVYIYLYKDAIDNFFLPQKDEDKSLEFDSNEILKNLTFLKFTNYLTYKIKRLFIH
jgi:hypothetical protein